METEDPKLAKGILFVDTVEFLRRKKGDEAVIELEKSGSDLIFDQYRMYPLESLIALQKEVVEMLYGNEAEVGYKELGADAFWSFASGVVGATLTNVAHSPKELLRQIQELWGSVVNFGSRKLVSIDESARHATLEIDNDPRNPAYLQGVVEASLKSIDIEAKTEIKKQGTDKYILNVTW